MIKIIDDRFKEGDYIISRTSGDMGIFNKIDKKGYVYFKKYYGEMFEEIKDKNFNFHMCYLKFFELCNEEEKKRFDEILADEKNNPEKYVFSLFRITD